ncbi:MAG: sugar phosphate isomerase/epimerase family protein [Candidatus Eremiobacterales bacterium]|jgi:sugar phosphate isomerase/epimerase
MKICCSSRSYARAIQSGDLTQLEWVDRCARLALDGVDFASAHFPRTDWDYLAQIRKLCADRGLTVAAVAIDGEIGGDADVDAQISLIETWIGNAVSLGAPLLRVSCGASTGSPGIAWRELIRGLKTISHAAKEKNVTLALEPRSGSLVSSPTDCKRALKECDSAWLRLAQDVSAALSPSGDGDVLFDEIVVAIARGGDTDAGAALTMRRRGFIGFMTLETSGADEDKAVGAGLERLRTADR